MIKIDFEFQSPYGIFRDALHLPADHGFSEAEINTLKQQRFDNWWAMVSAPAPEPVPADVVDANVVDGNTV